jgi:hypothetical protein
MKTIRVAAVSMNGLLGDRAPVLRTIAEWCGRPRVRGPELLGELARTYP